MATVETGVFTFIDNCRVSSFGQSGEYAQAERERLPGYTTEDNVNFDIPGKKSAAAGTIECYKEQDGRFTRLEALQAANTEVLISKGHGIALGSVWEVAKGYLTGHPIKFGAIPMFSLPYSISERGHGTHGYLRYYNAALAGAEDGTYFELTGGITSGFKMIWNFHPWSQSGGASTLTGHIESSVDNTFAAPTTEATLTSMTDVLGGGLGGDAQRHEIADTVSNTFFRVVIDGVTAGTWGLAAMAAIVKA